jgi:hypothetical protein
MDSFKYYLEIVTCILTTISLIWAMFKFLIDSTPSLKSREFDFGKYTIVVTPSKNWKAFKKVIPKIHAQVTGDGNIIE